MFNGLKLLCAAACVMVIGGQAQCAQVTYDLFWQGPSQSITASGSITLDDVIFSSAQSLANVLPSAFPGSGITAFNVTVSGTGGGDGTFTLPQFNGFIFVSSGALNGAAEIVGQPNFSDFNVGSLGSNPPPGVPFGVAPNTLYAGVTSFQLTSFAPAAATVPLPAGAVLLIGGLGGLSLVSSRKRKA